MNEMYKNISARTKPVPIDAGTAFWSTGRFANSPIGHGAPSLWFNFVRPHRGRWRGSIVPGNRERTRGLLGKEQAFAGAIERATLGDRGDEGRWKTVRARSVARGTSSHGWKQIQYIEESQIRLYQSTSRVLRRIVKIYFLFSFSHTHMEIAFYIGKTRPSLQNGFPKNCTYSQIRKVEKQRGEKKICFFFLF